MIRVLIVLICLIFAPLAASADPVRIFAASSLKTALDGIIADHGIEARIAYGGSAAMARQVAQGAQADIVILAHPEWMDWLKTQAVLAQGSVCDLIANRLVLAGPASLEPFEPKSAADFLDRLNGGRLATGQLKSVPAGQYTAAYLQGQGWLETLRPHLVETSNVRLALALVALGEAPLGFVYASDVAAEPSVRALFSPPNGSYPAIRYTAALTANARAAAQNALDLIAQSGTSFEAAGFTDLPAGDAARCN